MSIPAMSSDIGAHDLVKGSIRIICQRGAPVCAGTFDQNRESRWLSLAVSSLTSACRCCGSLTAAGSATQSSADASCWTTSLQRFALRDAI